MSEFRIAYDRYNRLNRDNRTALWELCEATYSESQTVSCARLADIIRVNKSSVEDWASVGWLLCYADNALYLAPDGYMWTLWRMWHNTDVLSYDHLLRTAKLAKRLEVSPDEILERLYNAIFSTQNEAKPQTAESLERDIEEAHEPQEVLLQRDLKRIGKWLKQNIDSLEFRGASRRLVLAFKILERRMAQELEGLEPK